MPHATDQQISDALQNWLFNGLPGAEQATKWMLRDTYKSDPNFNPGETYLKLDNMTRVIADTLKDYRDLVPLLAAVKNAVDFIHSDEIQNEQQPQIETQQPPQSAIVYTITDQQLTDAINNWLFDLKAHPNDPGYKRRSEESARNIICQTYVHDHDRHSGTTFERMDRIIREIAATPNRIANIADLTRILIHMHAVINILDYQEVQDNHGMPTITSLPPGSPPHLEAIVTEMVYECRELERRDQEELHKAYTSANESVTQMLHKEANDRQVAVHELDQNEETIKNLYAILSKINSEYQQNLQYLSTHYNNQINTNTAHLAEFDRKNARAMAEYQREYDKALAAYKAEEKEAKRTAKRKKKQAVYKSVAGVVIGAFIAPYAPVLASHIFASIGSGTLAAVAIEGAAFSAVSTAIAGGNVAQIAKSAVQGALFAGFGNAVGGAVQKIPIAVKSTELQASIRAAAQASSVALLSTVINDGNALKNIVTAAATAGVGEYILPVNQNVSSKATKTQQIVTKATDSVKRAVVVGVPVAVLSNKDLATSLVAASIGAVQAGAGSVAGSLGENMASGIARAPQVAVNTQTANASKPKARPKPKPTPTPTSAPKGELKPQAKPSVQQSEEARQKQAISANAKRNSVQQSKDALFGPAEQNSAMVVQRNQDRPAQTSLRQATSAQQQDDRRFVLRERAAEQVHDERWNQMMASVPGGAQENPNRGIRELIGAPHARLHSQEPTINFIKATAGAAVGGGYSLAKGAAEIALFTGKTIILALSEEGQNYMYEHVDPVVQNIRQNGISPIWEARKQQFRDGMTQSEALRRNGDYFMSGFIGGGTIGDAVVDVGAGLGLGAGVVRTAATVANRTTQVARQLPGFVARNTGLSWGSLNRGGSVPAGVQTAAPAYAQGNSANLVGKNVGNPILHQFKYKTTNIKTSDLQPTHGINYSKKAFEKFVAKIKTEGIQEPVRYVVHGGVKHIVDGHHRLFAARELNLPNIPAVEVKLPYKGYKTVNDLVFGL